MNEINIINKPKYWVAKVTNEKYFPNAKRDNFWLTQQRYNVQKNSAVTNILKQIKCIRENDILLLGYANKIFAYGNVIKPRDKTPDHISTLENVINKNKHEFFDGIVQFNDNSVFYEYLIDGCEDWGQRIDVDRWDYFDTKSEVTTKGIQDEIISGVSSMSLFEIKETYALKLINSLKTTFYNKNPHLMQIEQLKELLIINKNLILTGAPGTGKTYLANEIAISMNAEKEFVQFHPSYDYSDFVEGLRPTRKDNNEIGFELKDGIFKDFCKKALINLLDSKKSIEELKEQKKLSEQLSSFMESVNSEISDKGKFVLLGIGGKECAPIVEVNNDSFTIKTINGNFLTTPLATVLIKYRKYVENKNIKWTIKEVGEKLGITYHHTYYFAFLKAFDSFIRESKMELTDDIEIIKRKDFVFIIDEINRAEISKVFGELFFAIDPSYRGKDWNVKTQYSNLQNSDDIFFNGFYVPENVYIIGTMNDIDRSVESFDFAVRRRFTWVEIEAKESAKNMKLSKDIQTRMTNLNIAIAQIDGLNSSYHIGGAYFLDDKGKENIDYDLIWRLRLKTLIYEYLRGFPDSNEILVKLESIFNETIELTEEQIKEKLK